MLVATFGPTTWRAGKTITHEGGKFLLEGFGPITARAVLDYDSKGQLDWAYGEMRSWVQEVADSATPGGFRGAAPGADPRRAGGMMPDPQRSRLEFREWWPALFSVALLCSLVFNLVLFPGGGYFSLVWILIGGLGLCGVYLAIKETLFDRQEKNTYWDRNERTSEAYRYKKRRKR